jgi:hypothetical protein
MKHYNIKKIIKGYRVSPLLKTRELIGIPMKYDNMPIKVMHQDRSMVINRNTPLLHQEQFKDKFGRNRNYTLYYYEWCPNNNQASLF